MATVGDAPRPPRSWGVPARDLGPLTVAALVVAVAALWLLARPAGEPLDRHLGQLFGAESVLLVAIALVLVSTLPWIEAWFDGIDRAAIWHRRCAIAGLVLLAPHLAFASSDGGTALGGPLGAIGALGLVALAAWAILPRWRALAPPPLRGLVDDLRDLPGLRHVRRLAGGYDRWRLVHRATGLFAAAGLAHGLLDATAFDRAPALRWCTVLTGGIGLAFYVEREVLAPLLLSHHDYQVQAVHEVDDGLVEIVLRPLGRPLRFVPGQFAMVYLEARDGWHRHPFTIASAPHEEAVRVTVKALGDYTSRLPDLVEPGMPAVIGGPHGRFDRRRGTARQAWIGAGVGIAPFLSWVRALDAAPDGLAEEVHLFYSADGEAPFAAEIRAVAERHPSLHLRVVDTSREGRLTPEQVLAAAGGADGLSVFLCGPEPMLRRFTADLRRAGVPRGAIHREHFDWR